ncbi:MAG: Crp/Fnr family transcriptional regulator [Desulfobacter sp.]
MDELYHLPVFKHLTPGGRQRLESGTSIKQIKRANRILYKGAMASGAYIVLRGRLRVFSISPSGTEATLYFIDPGETCVLALNCLFQDLRYPAWVETETDTRVAVVTGPVYRRLFTEEASIQNLTVKALSTSVFRLMNALEHVHFLKLEHRLANLILSGASSNGTLSMTQQEIAGHLGTAREVVSRLVKSFVENNYIRTGRGMIQITDARAMADMVSGEIP